MISFANETFDEKSHKSIGKGEGKNRGALLCQPHVWGVHQYLQR